MHLFVLQKASMTCLKGNFDSCLGAQTFGFRPVRHRYLSFPPLRFSEGDEGDEDEGIGSSISSESVPDTPTSPLSSASSDMMEAPLSRRRKRAISGNGAPLVESHLKWRVIDDDCKTD